MTADVKFVASEIATPLAEAYVVDAGGRASDVREDLLNKRFDQAPVLKEGRLLGWVRTSHLGGRGQVESAAYTLDRCAVLSHDTPLADVIALLDQAGLIFLARANGIDLFVVPSDLDRLAVRSYLYVILSQIESRLAELVRGTVPESEIKEHFTADASRRYQEARDQNRETHAVEYLYLSNYRTLIPSSEQLAAKVGWGRALTKEDLVRLNRLRNCVAHPSKSLTGEFAPADIAERASSALKVLSELEKVSAGGPYR